MIPLATYRLQLRPGFGFAEARAVVPYLAELGISHLYLSPIAEARSGSEHGYDVVNPLRVAPALGGEDGLHALAEAARAEGLGIVVDIVPNHMAASVENPWWYRLLELGHCSRFATMFDIDWDVAGPAGTKRMLLPLLGQPYGQALASGELCLQARADGPVVCYYEHAFPIDPGTWELALAGDRETMSAARLQALLAACGALGPACRSDADRGRARRVRTLRREWRALWAHDDSGAAIARALAATAADPERFDRLLTEQPYRLAHWRLAADVAGYRRFFDIADLVAVRIEDAEVFRRVHRKTFALMRAGIVDGLRIDHVDGLRDPRGYLERVRAVVNRCCAGREPWIIVEKILCGDERVPADWPVDGTTGYEFAAALTRLLVDPHGLEALRELYASILGEAPEFEDLARDAKREVAHGLFRGELARLGDRLVSLAQADPDARDLPPSAMRRALIALTADLPVYRTYFENGDAPQRATDIGRVRNAAAATQAREPELAPALAFLEHLITEPPGAEAAAFVAEWQQLTGPVMAKGVEDCAFYRDPRLIALNEVGSDPAAPRARFGVAAFHAYQQRTWQGRLRSMNTTATHDTKRGEDARCRLDVLSEIAPAWGDAVRRFRTANQHHKTWIAGRESPDVADEVLLYQALLGAWPADSRRPNAELRERIAGYMVKAAREARLHTSWHDPDPAYEQALASFTAAILDEARSAPFLAELLALRDRVAFYGAMSSLSLVTMKAMAPGIPDFYQGGELWDLDLVDPDNRRAVDFEQRASLLRSLRAPVEREVSRSDNDAGAARLSRSAAICADVLDGWRDGRIKLLVTTRALELRRRFAALMREGDYLALELTGLHRERVCAFARRLDDAWVACVAPIRFASLSPAGTPPIGGEVWGDTRLHFPPGAPAAWRDELHGARVDSARGAVELGAVLAHLPVALLVA